MTITNDIVGAGMMADARAHAAAFFDQLKATVLAQLDAGATATFRLKHFTQPVYSPEAYGPMPLDVRFVGCSWAVTVNPFVAAPPPAAAADTPAEVAATPAARG